MLFSWCKIGFLPPVCPPHLPEQNILTTHILRLSLQFPLTSLSNNLSTLDCPTKQFKHSLFCGSQPEFRWEKNSSKQKAAYFPAGIYAEQEREQPCLGARFSCICRGDMKQKKENLLQRHQCFCCLSSIFFSGFFLLTKWTFNLQCNFQWVLVWPVTKRHRTHRFMTSQSVN